MPGGRRRGAFIAASSAAGFDTMRGLLAPDLVAGHLLQIDCEEIVEWWMVDGKPAESDAFWAS